MSLHILLFPGVHTALFLHTQVRHPGEIAPVPTAARLDQLHAKTMYVTARVTEEHHPGTRRNWIGREEEVEKVVAGVGEAEVSVEAQIPYDSYSSYYR